MKQCCQNNTERSIARKIYNGIIHLLIGLLSLGVLISIFLNNILKFKKHEE